jgi:hypothetical protein
MKRLPLMANTNGGGGTVRAHFSKFAGDFRL